MKKLFCIVLSFLFVCALIATGCKKNPTTPGATPTITPTFTAGIDSYEPDDTTGLAKPIAFGVSQWHNITPAADVDTVYFNVTAGNRYMIKATDTGNVQVNPSMEFSYDTNDYFYYCYQEANVLPYTYEVYYATFTAQVFLQVNSYTAYAGNDATYTLKVTQMPAFSTRPLGTALDNTGLTYSTGGDAAWFGQTEISSLGGSAAQSGHIGNSQTTYLATTATCSNVSFKWKVSSEACCDGLTFYVDGSFYATYFQNEGGWATISTPVTPGSHVLSWVYSRDSSDNWGYDAGWVDDLVITP